MKRGLALALALLFGLTLCFTPASAAELTGTFDAKSVLLMEANSGKVLYESNADEPLPPASVTKIMTMLLVMEEIDSGRLSYTDLVTVSEHAAAMGGSQVFLKVGETMSVEDMLKSVTISSANDAALALAEHIAGSEEAFVARMNEKAAALGMKNTRFENTNGLDDTTQNHLTTARDIALMSRELIINHPDILKYSSTWMDTIRNGEFGLSNTNRLVRFYPGATGLKTGSTAKAKFCISATAERNGMHLIAVVMGSSTRDARNETAKKLLDFGFANYTHHTFPGDKTKTLEVTHSLQTQCTVHLPDLSVTVEKKDLDRVQMEITLPERLQAPIEVGQSVGKVTYTLDGQLLCEGEILAAESVEKTGFMALFCRLLRQMFSCCPA